MQRILILGGGTGGTLLADLLARSIGERATITIVSSNVQHPKPKDPNALMHHLKMAFNKACFHIVPSGWV